MFSRITLTNFSYFPVDPGSVVLLWHTVLIFQLIQVQSYYLKKIVLIFQLIQVQTLSDQAVVVSVVNKLSCNNMNYNSVIK